MSSANGNPASQTGPAASNERAHSGSLPPRRRKRHLDLGLLALAMIACGGALSAGPPEGESPTALLRFGRNQPSLLRANPSQESGEGGYATFVQTQKDLIRSRTVLAKALSDPNIAKLEAVKRHPDPVRWLSESLGIDGTANSEIVRISLPGTEPRDAAAVINAVIDAYLSQFVNSDQDRRHSRLQSLKKVYNDYQTSLSERRESLHQLERSLDSSEARNQAIERQILPQELAECRRELRRVKLTKAAAQVRLSRAEADKVAREKSPERTSKLAEEVAVLTEQEKVLNEEMKELLIKGTVGESTTPRLEERKDDIEHVERAARKIWQEVEALMLELQVPPRVQMIERAEAPVTK